MAWFEVDSNDAESARTYLLDFDGIEVRTPHKLVAACYLFGTIYFSKKVYLYGNIENKLFRVTFEPTVFLIIPCASPLWAPSPKRTEKCPEYKHFLIFCIQLDNNDYMYNVERKWSLLFEQNKELFLVVSLFKLDKQSSFDSWCLNFPFQSFNRFFAWKNSK